MMLAFCFALSLFGLLEILRAFRVHLVAADAGTFHQFMVKFTDKGASPRNWDDGTFILSHIYLLVGCGLPALIGGGATTAVHRWAAVSGPIMVGLADAAASIVGRRYGRHFIPGRQKTLEGTLAAAAVVIVIAACGMMIPGSVAGSHYLITWARCALCGVVLEAFSTQNDNLTIGLYVAALCFCRDTNNK